MKLIAKITFIILILNACSNNGNFHTNSKLKESFSLKKIDSLVFKDTPDFKIGSIADFVKWNDDKIIVDNINKCLVVFNKKNHFKKRLGKLGEGPGEYKSTPIVIKSSDKDHLYVFDYKLRRISKYDKALNFLFSTKITSDVFINLPMNVIKFKNNYVFQGCKINESGSIKNNPALVVLNDKFEFQKNFLKWAEIYKNKNVYAIYNPFVGFDFCGENLYAIQSAELHKVYKINSNYEIENSFGREPRFYKDPPEVKLETIMSSIDATNKYVSQITKLSNFIVDKQTGRIFINYVNYNKNVAITHSVLDGQHYLQIYDINFDCIFDKKIKGKLISVFHNKIYIYVSDEPNNQIIEVYKLYEK